MKKIVLVSLVMGFALVTRAQDTSTSLEQADSKCNFGTKATALLQHFSLSATGGTPSFSVDALKAASLREFSQVSVGELNLSYRINSRFSAGVSLMGALGNCSSGYYTEGDQFVAFVTDDDDDDHDAGENYGDDGNDDEEACGDDELGNVMGTVNFKFPEGIPFFIQAAGGYSLNYSAPAYSAMVGYYHDIIAGFGVMGGVRFSDILHQLPADGIRLAPTGGIKAEVGINWNF